MNTKTQPTYRETVQRISQVFVSRAQELGLKGKARDKAALEFACGAAAYQQATGHGEELTKFAWLVSIRGYSWIAEMAKVPT